VDAVYIEKWVDAVQMEKGGRRPPLRVLMIKKSGAETALWHNSAVVRAKINKT
jgi:hypothetical protein